MLAGKREVLSLMVHCARADLGCEWTGEIRDLNDHVCDYVVTKCPQNCNMDNILRKHLQSHMQNECSERDFECPHCNEREKYSARVGSHLEQCPMVLVECPNEDCEVEICAALVSFHVAVECDYMLLECRYKTGGCTVWCLRDLPKHEEDHKYHLKIVMEHVQELRRELESYKDNIRQHLQKPGLAKIWNHIKLRQHLQKRGLGKNWNHTKLRQNLQKPGLGKN